jgi:hypothetical protein
VESFTPGLFELLKRAPSGHWEGGSVVLRSSLDTVKTLFLPGIELLFLGPSAGIQSFY